MRCTICTGSSDCQVIALCINLKSYYSERSEEECSSFADTESCTYGLEVNTIDIVTVSDDLHIAK